MMNKKGSGISAFLTKGLIIGFIFLILFSIWGTGGGFKATWELGKIMAKIPVWVYLLIGVIWLVNQMRR